MMMRATTPGNCKGRTSLSRRAAWVLALAAPAFLERAAVAGDLSWSTGSDGTFSVPGNWIGGVAPGTGDFAHFQTGAAGSFIITFNADASTQGLIVHSDRVKFDLGS